METQLSRAVREVSFAVQYQEFSGVGNLDFRGKGNFEVSSAEPSSRFTGKTRAILARAHVMQFHSDEIWNVITSGRKVQFETRAGKSGSKGKPFVFFCASPAEATEVGQLLPQTKNQDFVTSQDFAEKLKRLPAASSPWTSITNLIVGINVLAFVIMGFLGAGWIETANMRPYLLYVANNGGATTDGEWWRIVTSMFVHYGVIHLGLNMWALFQTGHFVEKLFGRALFFAAYFGSGIIASFTSIIVHGDKVWSAGASGAVFGVYGMLLGFMLREKQSIPKPVLQPLLKSTLLFAAYNLIYGMIQPQIDNAAHLGGLIGGVFLGWLVALPIEAETRTRLSPARLRMAVAAVFAVTVAGIIASPRFGYRFREELLWADTIKAPIANEAELIKRQAGKAVFQKGNDVREFTTWLENDPIPFYEKWRNELTSMALTANKLTAQRRQTLKTLIESKLANYRQLAVDLRESDPKAISRYAEAEKRAVEAAQKQKK